MITKVVVTYDFDDTKKATFEAAPAVPATEAVPAVGVDMSAIPAEKSE